MAELTYNDLLSQLSGQEQDQFQGVFGSKGWLGNYQDNPNAPMVTGHSSYDKFKPIADAAAQSKTLNNSFWSNLNPFGTAADAAMPTAEERAAIERSSADIERRGIGEDTSDLSGIAATSVWGNPRYDTTAPFREGDFMDMPFQRQHPEFWTKQGDPGEQSGIFRDVPVDPLDPSVHERWPGTTNYSQWWNPNRNPAPRYYSHIFGDEGNNAIDIQENITPEKLTILDEERSGPVIESDEEQEYINQGITSPNILKRMFQRAGNFLGKPGLSPTQQGYINRYGRNFQGRMHSGPFQGQNLFGTSMFGSKTAKEQALKNLNKWGNLAHGGRVGYKTGGRVGILSAF